MKKCVIIGAGQTGRGFIAPMVQKSGHELVFLDHDRELVQALHAQGSYTVTYYMDAAPSIAVNGYQVWHTQSAQAKDCLSQADYIFTAVGGQNIKDLVPLLKQAQLKKDATVILCENGIHVKQPLVEAGLDAAITEGIIFCTTLKGQQLDLLCEVYPNIPYDASVEGVGEIDVCGFEGTQDFPALIQRKIYTYNCLSACIAYLGAYKGYAIYADAAHDEEIAVVMDGMMQSVNRALAKEYTISTHEQDAFAAMAFAKFKNREIVDTIERNTRDVQRKLLPNERMITPLRVCVKHGEDTRLLELVIAAALHTGGLQAAVLSQVSGIDDLPKCTARIATMLAAFHAGKPLTAICALPV